MRRKICTRCKKNLLVSKFRMKLDRGEKRYPNATCRKCDAELASIHHNKVKDDPKFKKKNCDRAKRYVENNRIKVKEKLKKVRATKEYRRYVKKYYRKNRPKILVQHRAVCKRYGQRQRDEVTEQYVFQILTHPREGLTRQQLRQYPELIKLYQSNIKLKRLCKKLQTSNS